jgi:hypothetical protein
MPIGGGWLDRNSDGRVDGWNLLRLGLWRCRCGLPGLVTISLPANPGLTHLGARLYDPKLGRFISVDPIVDHFQPQSLHG